MFYLGWRWGFFGPGILCLVAALLFFWTIADKPTHKGVSPTENEANSQPAHGVWQEQLSVLKNPWIWIIGLASASLYVARYALEDWGFLYLQEAKQHSLTTTGVVKSAADLIEILGTILAGPTTDVLFRSRRGPAAALYGALLSAGMLGLFFGPSLGLAGDIFFLALAQFACGGLLVYLGGLIAMDLSDKRVAGAALGFIGLFSYVGAGLNDWVSGLWLGETAKRVGSQVMHDFGAIRYVWTAGALVALSLSVFYWMRETSLRRTSPERPS